jgi:hypothetical protein
MVTGAVLRPVINLAILFMVTPKSWLSA